MVVAEQSISLKTRRKTEFRIILGWHKAINAVYRLSRANFFHAPFKITDRQPSRLPQRFSRLFRRYKRAEAFLERTEKRFQQFFSALSVTELRFERPEGFCRREQLFFKFFKFHFSLPAPERTDAAFTCLYSFIFTVNRYIDGYLRKIAFKTIICSSV